MPIKAAEEAGYEEWQSLGGTSAGAIMAMALAVGYGADGLKELFSFGGQPPRTFGDLKRTLEVVGAVIVHERMVLFPDDAGKYLDDDREPYTPVNFPLATAVRISAGYPGFFPPITLRDAAPGSSGALVDGGVVSSFPAFLFDDPKPQWPTWAFLLFAGSSPERPPNNPIRASCGRST